MADIERAADERAADERGVVKVPLTRGCFAIVDECDARDVLRFKWYATPGSRAGVMYAARTFGGRKSKHSITMQKFITGYAMTDHINGDGLDNRRCNLRSASQAENHHNVFIYQNNTTGFKGVNFDKQTLRWAAKIRVDGVEIWLGRHDSPEAAALAYDNAAREYHGEFARLNFPKLGERSAR